MRRSALDVADIRATIASYANYNTLQRLNIEWLIAAYLYSKRTIICGKYKYSNEFTINDRYRISKYHYEDYSAYRDYYRNIIYVNDEMDGELYYYKSYIVNIRECKYIYNVRKNNYDISVNCEKEDNIRYRITINATRDYIKIYSYKWSLNYTRQYHDIYEYNANDSDIYKLAQSRIAMALRLKKNMF